MTPFALDLGVITATKATEVVHQSPPGLLLFRVLLPFTFRVSLSRSTERCHQMQWDCRCGWHRFSRSTNQRSTRSCSRGARASGCKPASGARRRWRRWPGRQQDEKRRAPWGTGRLPLSRRSNRRPPLHHHHHHRRGRHSRRQKGRRSKTGRWMMQHPRQAVVHRRRPRRRRPPRPRAVCLWAPAGKSCEGHNLPCGTAAVQSCLRYLPHDFLPSLVREKESSLFRCFRAAVNSSSSPGALSPRYAAGHGRVWGGSCR